MGAAPVCRTSVKRRLSLSAMCIVGPGKEGSVVFIPQTWLTRTVHAKADDYVAERQW